MSTNISLTPEIEAYAQSQISNGFYSSMSEFVREAIRLHQTREQFYLRELHKDLSLAADQIDNGQTEPHNMQAIIDEVKLERQAQD